MDNRIRNQKSKTKNQKIGREKFGVKSARLQADSQIERDFLIKRRNGENEKTASARRQLKFEASSDERGRWCVAPDEVCSKGISLISLIITIIVIIILAAIVIFNGFGTTESAQFAKFTQEFSGIKEEVQDEFMDEKIRGSVKGNTESDNVVYSRLGEERGDVASLLQGKDLSTPLTGEKAYKVEKERKSYEGETGVYVTDKGEVFSLPGYRYVTNNETRYYINESTYYTGDPMESVDAISVVSIYGVDASADAWNFLSEASSLISSDSLINSTSKSATFTKDDKPYVIRVGDEFSVGYDGRTEPVIVLGFNYDDKADGTGKAGITFGFKNILKTCELSDLITDYSLPLFVFSSECEDMLDDISEATRNNILQVTKKTKYTYYDFQDTDYAFQNSEVLTNNYLWSLAWAEMSSNSETYAYYATKYDASTLKIFASKSYNGVPTDFWLRKGGLKQGGTCASLDWMYFGNEDMTGHGKINIPYPQKPYVDNVWVKSDNPEIKGLSPCFCI